MFNDRGVAIATPLFMMSALAAVATVVGEYRVGDISVADNLDRAVVIIELLLRYYV